MKKIISQDPNRNPNQFLNLNQNNSLNQNQNNSPDPNPYHLQNLLNQINKNQFN